MNGNQELFDQLDGNTDVATEQPHAYEVGQDTSNGLSKIAIGALIGATLGAIAGALTIKGTAEKVNQTVKNVGDKVKDAAQNFNQNVALGPVPPYPSFNICEC